MWGAIKNDLLSFVTTIQEDTTSTLNRVLGDGDDEEEEDITLQEKLVADLRRSYETYETPIRENDLKDYEKFKKSFSMSSSAAEIARVLDEESEVSRFYAELVPISMSPEEFWGRLFFRMNQIYRNGSANLDLEDDEEELVWEEEEEFVAKTEVPPETVAEEFLALTDIAEAGAKMKAGSSQTLQTSSADSSTNTANPTSTKGAQTASTSDQGSNNSVDAQQVAQIISLNEHMKERVQVLESDNQRLLSHEEELLRRIQELEARLAAQDVAQVIPAIPAVESDHKDATKATTTPPSKRRTTKSAVSGTTSPAPGNDNLATPPASVEPSGKKKGSTAKKLFDSPAPSPAPTVVATVQAEPVVAEQAEKEEAAPVVTIAAVSADHVSQSSDESAVVVNHTDNPSDDDLHRPTTHSASTASASSANAAGAAGKGAFSSQETAKYLAALDDQDDEEEDGWN
mmetsp:Transcript_54395/g.94960  ORF Transcript_54395/g.94960 Transcript_54395/m.94960 type:complete len:457 (-) Transcript_54395:202-1572(-)|eukprot:CAMPEP_0184988650 /NCGR_PEP_ID=MMETSP1098-20130426/24985_1 /TAXON_ID=89044 /ORGANISM="Spumella elongata, Strain CCAP 955/1" /LENGTH=456 /DNA_ID=CAMNT_0027513459 /DNA_START=66 /DNA_END=1436 /DNA_ORIENTATION=+